jgi:pSer/pThr/pTyr-binding forkhead associated (FHA) protein
MQVKLRTFFGKMYGTTVTVTRSPFLIGRADDCDLRPALNYVSRYHCKLTMKGSHLFVRDLESRNGTFVNGKRIEVDHTLRHGDVIALGPLLYEIQITEDECLLSVDEVPNAAIKLCVA